MWDKFINLMIRVRMRGLFYDYYGLNNNVQFRVHIIL